MKYCFACFCLWVISPTVLAQKLIGFSANPAIVSVNEKVTFSVMLEMSSDTAWCGLSINTGDGGRIRGGVGDKGPSIIRDHVYKSPGRYLVIAEGEFLARGLKSAVPCQGDAIAIEVQVRDPLEERRKQEAALKEKELVEKEQKLRELELKLKAETLLRELEDARQRELRAVEDARRAEAEARELSRRKSIEKSQAVTPSNQESAKPRAPAPGRIEGF